MARTSQIKIEVQKGNSVSTIKDIIKAFEDLKKSRDSIGKDGKISVQLDIKDGGKTKELAELMKVLRTEAMTTARAVTMLRSSYNNLSSTVTKANSTINKFNNTSNGLNTGSLATIATLGALSMALKSNVKDYLEYTDALYGVGIASQMSLSGIDKLGSAFYDLSNKVPATATGLAQAVDDLIRTGRSLEDSQKIIKEVAILSTASGDSLKDTAQVVTKVMVALNISGDRVADTLTTMHSTAIQTASDMGYLAEAFKNIASGASVLALQSGKVGEELDDYKQKILDISMASVGVLANTGLSASYFQ